MRTLFSVVTLFRWARQLKLGLFSSLSIAWKFRNPAKNPRSWQLILHERGPVKTSTL